MSCYGDENYEYKMPEKIKDKFTEEMMHYFINEFAAIFFYQDGLPSHNDMAYSEGTVGWHNAFNNMCKKYGLDYIVEYLDSLEWYDYDWFCGEFSNLLLEKNIIKEY